VLAGAYWAPAISLSRRVPVIFRAKGRTLGRGRCLGGRTRAPSAPPGVDPSTPLSEGSKMSF
jgi:hypothetical protein